MFRFPSRRSPPDTAPTDAVPDFLGLPEVKRRAAEKMREETDDARDA